MSFTAIAMLRNPGSAAVPGLPGATKTWSTFGDSPNLHASACSRPPEPITRIFMGRRYSMPEMTATGEYHRHAVFVGGADHFLVTH